MKRILVIENNEVDSFILHRVLQKLPITLQTTTFLSGLSALEYLDRPAVEIPDAIFLDLYMPLMDGFEFLEAFSKLEIARHKIRIMILTNSVDLNNIRKAQKLGADAYVIKPVPLRDLETNLRAWGWF